MKISPMGYRRFGYGPDAGNHNPHTFSSKVTERLREKLRQCEDRCVNVVALCSSHPQNDLSIDAALLEHLCIHLDGP